MAKHIKKFNESLRKLIYETEITDKVIQLIESQQEYLTKPENLPQLAKLGYIFSTLHRAGRTSFGHNGIVMEDDSCEGNPKDNIESIDYKSDEINDLVYDAWGMHYNDDECLPSYEEFYKFVFSGKELSELEIKIKKPNKTLDEWVEILTNPKYRYRSLYPNRQKVINSLLSVSGTEYALSNGGYIINRASGADQDIDIYGDWENAKFPENISIVIKHIISNKLVIEGLEEAHKFSIEYRKKRDRKSDIYQTLSDEMKVMMKELETKRDEEEKKIIKGFNWYPIGDSSNISKMLDNPNTHPSYIKAGIEMCKDIVENEPSKDSWGKSDEARQRAVIWHKQNRDFAEKFLKKFDK